YRGRGESVAVQQAMVADRGRRQSKSSTIRALLRCEERLTTGTSQSPRVPLRGNRLGLRGSAVPPAHHPACHPSRHPAGPASHAAMTSGEVWKSLEKSREALRDLGKVSKSRASARRRNRRLTSTGVHLASNHSFAASAASDDVSNLLRCVLTEVTLLLRPSWSPPK